MDKPAGPSSHGCVVAARRRSLAKKIGHAGTLDPFATGVLPLLLGTATRLSRFFTGSRKRYETVVRFGAATDTGDASGAPLIEAPVPDGAAVRDALARFRGRSQQVPPAFSAKSVGGVRSYKRARAGDLTAPPPIEVEIGDLALTDWRAPDATLTVECSAGTYIRSLARDLGEACGSAAHCVELRRVAAGAFGLEHAISFSTLQEAGVDELGARIVPMRSLLPGLPAVAITERGVAALRHGKLIVAHEFEAAPGATESQWVRVTGPDGDLLALGEFAAKFGRPDDLHASLVLC